MDTTRRCDCIHELVIPTCDVTRRWYYVDSMYTLLCGVCIPTYILPPYHRYTMYSGILLRVCGVMCTTSAHRV